MAQRRSFCHDVKPRRLRNREKKNIYMYHKIWWILYMKKWNGVLGGQYSSRLFQVNLEQRTNCQQINDIAEISDNRYIHVLLCVYNLSSHVHFFDTQKKCRYFCWQLHEKKLKTWFFFGVVNNTYRFMHELGWEVDCVYYC